MTEPIEAGTTGVVAPTPAQSMMERDFPPPPPPPAAEPTPPPPQKFVREIDLKDGSGVQKFEAETWEGLVDKLAQAQENATRKIRELSQRPRIEPERDVPTARAPKALSEAEILAMKEGFSADPIAAVNKIIEARLGMPLDQVGTKLTEFEQQQQRQEAERNFIAKHKDDFYNCPENAQKITAFFAKEGLPVTKKNLEYAYQELQSDFVRKEAAPVLPPPPAPPAPQVRDIPPPPVTIPANFGERVETRTDIGGVDAAEYAKIATLPPDQMKARIEQLFRAQRGSAR